MKPSERTRTSSRPLCLSGSLRTPKPLRLAPLPLDASLRAPKPLRLAPLPLDASLRAPKPLRTAHLPLWLSVPTFHLRGGHRRTFHYSRPRVCSLATHAARAKADGRLAALGLNLPRHQYTVTRVRPVPCSTSDCHQSTACTVQHV